MKGGQFYGNFPLLAPGGSNDAGTRGVLLPTTAVDQYGATLAQWFGVPQQPAHGVSEYREFRDESARLLGLTYEQRRRAARYFPPPRMPCMA